MENGPIPQKNFLNDKNPFLETKLSMEPIKEGARIVKGGG
jgi:hypothetical protein